MTRGRLDRLLLDACALHRERIALTGDAGERLSYGELKRRAGEVAAGLGDAGLEPADPVLVAVGNRPEDVVAYLGVWLAGGVVVPVHEKAARPLFDGLRDRTGARLLVACGETAWPPYADSAGASATLFARLLRAEPVRRDPLLERAALVIFTSGSTGLPKGVVLEHGRYREKLASIQDVLGFEPGTTSLLVLQLTFSFGLWMTLLTLATGGTVLLRRRFDADETLRTFARERVDRAAVVPTMLRLLLPLLEAADPSGRPGPGLIVTGGEVLPAPLGVRIRELLPDTAIADVYGLTETASADFVLRPAEYDAFPGTIGRPSTERIEYRIRDERGSRVAPGEAGELEVRTPFLMRGYLGDPDSTAASLADGFFRTGDLARERDGSAVEIVGRVKSLVNRGGNKISPLEVENAFAAHPDVAGALATGVPDETYGERLYLAVVARSGRSVDGESLGAWARSRLDPYKLPDRIVEVDAIPVGATGKADRNLLREQILAGNVA